MEDTKIKNNIIDKAAKILQRIKDLDKSIRNLDKMAGKISELGSSAEFTMAVQDPSYWDNLGHSQCPPISMDIPCDARNKEFSSLGQMWGEYLKNVLSTYPPGGPTVVAVSSKNEGILELHQKLPANDALRILQIILKSKLQKRQRLLDLLNGHVEDLQSISESKHHDNE